MNLKEAFSELPAFPRDLLLGDELHSEQDLQCGAEAFLSPVQTLLEVGRFVHGLFVFWRMPVKQRWEKRM